MILVDGANFGEKEKTIGHAVKIGETIDITIEFTAPQVPNKYIGFYKLAHGMQRKFGPKVWCDIQVKGKPEEIK